MLTPQTTVASLVLEHSACAEVLQRHRIDYCCKGNLSIEAAANVKGIDSHALLNELTQAINSRHAQTFDARSLSTAALLDHIVRTHHDYLRTTLPFLVGLAAKVARVHGDRNDELTQLAASVDELAGVLLPHLDEEEQRLFPALTSPDATDEDRQRMLLGMEHEHGGVAQILERIRGLAEDFVPPAWACNSYRTLLLELAELERDIHVHVHLENHVLLPRFKNIYDDRAELVAIVGIVGGR